jgi:tetratricopeptide (TPR) repeat protein
MVHRACAETIVGVDPVSRTRRARHLALAGDVDGACEVFHEVLDAGWLRADVSSAASTSRQALAVAERLGLPELEAHAAIVLGWAWMRAGSLGEGAALCEQGRDRADALGRDLHAAFAEVQLGHHARFQGKDAEATRWLELAAHRLDGAALRDTATGTAVRHLLWEEQVGAAIAVADRSRVVSLLAQQMGRTRTHRERLSAVLSGAEAFVYLRDDAEMVRWLEQADPLEHAAGPAEVRLLAYLRGQHALGLQRWDDARVAFERAVSEAEADGHTAFALGCRGRLADVLRQQGNLDEARSAFEDLLGAHQRRGSAHGATAARCNLALVALQQDREDDADVLLLEAEEGTRPESVMASFVHGLALVVAFRRGDLDGIAYELAQVAHPALVMDEDIIRDAVGEIAAAEDPAWDAVAATARGWIS